MGFMQENSADGQPHERAEWMRILALSTWDDLEACSAGHIGAGYTVLRAPETGLIMLRGRMGGTGAPFNFGEATVTRCAVRLANGLEGHAYVLGRNPHHARTAAVCDALLQDEAQGSAIRRLVIDPLREKLMKKHLAKAQKAAATKVDFFTLVRGDD